MLGRFREIVSDPINLLIQRVPRAGFVTPDMRVVLHNGHTVPATGAGSYYGPFSQVLIINRGVHEPLEEFVFQEMLRVMPEAPTMIELGAYWAHYSMWMMQARPKARTIMIEPEAAGLEAGRANYAANGFGGEFIQAFVGKDKWRLDPFVEERSLKHIDVLHVDIQGNEVELLDGGSHALANHVVDYLFVSTHSQPLHQRCAALISGWGYRIEANSDFKDTTSFDGLLFATSPTAKPVFNGLNPFRRMELVRMTQTEIASRLESLQAAIVNR